MRAPQPVAASANTATLITRGIGCFSGAPTGGRSLDKRVRPVTRNPGGTSQGSAPPRSPTTWRRGRSRHHRGDSKSSCSPDRGREAHQQKHSMPPSADRSGPPSASFGEKQPGGHRPPSGVGGGGVPQPVAAEPRITTLIVVGSDSFFVIWAAPPSGDPTGSLEVINTNNRGRRLSGRQGPRHEPARSNPTGTACPHRIRHRLLRQGSPHPSRSAEVHKTRWWRERPPPATSGEAAAELKRRSRRRRLRRRCGHLHEWRTAAPSPSRWG